MERRRIPSRVKQHFYEKRETEAILGSERRKGSQGFVEYGIDSSFRADVNRGLRVRTRIFKNQARRIVYPGEVQEGGRSKQRRSISI